MNSRRSSSSSSDDSNDVTENDNQITNVFRNDGSFLEMFKKMQEANQKDDTSTATNAQLSSKDKKTAFEKELILKEEAKLSKSVPIVGRRKSTKALPVGKVKKLKAGEEEARKPPITDAWAKYLEEVKKYKETYCDSEAKNRSLVK